MEGYYAFKRSSQISWNDTKKVAVLLGVNQNTYSYWETEKTKINSGSLKKLAEIFNTSVDYLLGDDTPTYPISNPNGNHNGDIHINTAAHPADTVEKEQLLYIFDRLTDDSKTQLMSVAYLIMSQSLKAQGLDIQKVIEQQLHKIHDEGGEHHADK